MNSTDAFFAEQLQACALALQLEAMAFYLPPSEPFLTTLDNGELLAEWPLGPHSPLTVRGLELLRTALASAPAASLLPALRGDYTALFVGLEQVGAPPWESVYLSRDHLLFDEQTLAVRQAYAQYGLQIPKLEREPDDHIGFELLFLAHLLEQAGHALTRNDDAAQGYLQAAQAFLQEHPQRWVEQFVERVLQRAETDYYRGWACLLTGSLIGLTVLLRQEDAQPETPETPGAESNGGAG